MFFWFMFLFIIILILGRYNLNGHKIMPKNFAFIYVEMLIILLTILRFNVGFDWHSYFRYIYPVMDVQQVNSFEPIPKLFYYVANYFNSPILVFIFHGLPTLILIFISIRDNSVSQYESLIIFLSLFYLESLGTLRQWLAISILVYGFKYIRTNNVRKYLVISFIAFMCHKSSLIGAVGILLLYKWLPVGFTIVCCLGCVFLSKHIINLLTISNLPYVAFYFRNILGNSLGNEKTKYAFLLFWLICAFLYKIKGNTSFYEKKILAIVLSGIIWPFILGGHIGSRIGIYFYVYFIFLIPLALKNIKSIKIHCLGMSFFYLYFFLMLFINLNSKHPVYNYRLYPLEENNYKYITKEQK